MCRDKNPVRKKGPDMAKKTVKLRPWTATEVYKLKGLAKKKVGAVKIAKALKRTTRAVENKSYLLRVSLDPRGRVGGVHTRVVLVPTKPTVGCTSRGLFLRGMLAFRFLRLIFETQKKSRSRASSKMCSADKTALINSPCGAV